jgi:2-amino-4-hydroxy-6-hydroxymethyldihydropteridine diphosphokinase
VTRAFIGLGSNLGDRVASLQGGLDALAALPGVRVLAASGVYESEPWGVTDQPAFANAVALLEVTMGPDDLLAACKRIEAEAGRVSGVRYGPRPLDLDILLFGDETVMRPDLTVPHPRMLERDFVVTPLLEIAPDATLPDGTWVTCDGASAGHVTGVLSSALEVPRGRAEPRPS